VSLTGFVCLNGGEHLQARKEGEKIFVRRGKRLRLLTKNPLSRSKIKLQKGRVFFIREQTPMIKTEANQKGTFIERGCKGETRGEKEKEGRGHPSFVKEKACSLYLGGKGRNRSEL